MPGISRDFPSGAGDVAAGPRNLYKFWYTICMANHAVVPVHPLSEVRARLSGILARFRDRKSVV